LTFYNDTLYAIDRSDVSYDRVVNFDSDYMLIVDNAIDLDYDATDLVFINDEIWICDRDNKMLRKIE
jgi:hypothetical protein